MENESLVRLLGQFHKEVYMHQQLYVIDTNLKGVDGLPIHTPSNDQRTEKERLEEKYLIWDKRKL